MADGDGLTRVQHRAVAALLVSRTVQEAADTAKVSVRSLERWLASPAFVDAYRAEARAVCRDAMTALLAAQREAVASLRRALVEGTPAQQVRAARALLEVGVRVQQDDVAERLDQVEEVLNTSWPYPMPPGSGSRVLKPA